MDLSEYLCIVPARTGSKRLPDKNFLDFCGKPLWMWSVDCASRVGFPPYHIVVSTDGNDSHPDPRGFTWLRRSDFLATDEALLWWVVEHACYTLEHFGPVVVLQPTSPLRTPEQVLDVMKRLHDDTRCKGATSTDDVWTAKPNGGVWVSKWKAWGCMFDFVPVQAACGIDINTQEDWDRAEEMMRQRMTGGTP